MTPNSNSSAYVTGAQFLARYDQKYVAQLLSDTGTAVTDLPNDPVLNQLLGDASAELESALLVGGRYNPSDITALLATDLSGNFLYVGANKVVRIICDLAMGMLRDRRAMPESDPFPPFIHALQELELLRKGEEILPFFEVQTAGQTGDAVIQPYQMREQGRLTSVFNRYFGDRADVCTSNDGL